jgi:formate-dependent phosphoribosylglycinamide formyltransferase (GAR transformylase)
MNLNQSSEYCLLLGADMRWRERALPGAARAVAMPLAVMQDRGAFERNRAADLVIEGNPLEPVAALKAVLDFEMRTGKRPGAVVPLVEMAVQPGLSIAQHFGLRYLSASSVSMARDKAAMKRAFCESGLPTPRFAIFSTFAELRQLMPKIGYPAVVKPTNFGGSEGVRLIQNESQLVDGFAHVHNAMQGHARDFGLVEDSFQIEEFIAADHEISVEVLNGPGYRRVVGMTDKFLTPLPYFAEIGHSTPSILSGNHEICSIAIKACEAIGVDRGIAHVEMRIRGNGEPVLMEVNARIAGDGIPDLVERVSGINLFWLHAWSYARDDVPPDEQNAPRGRAAIAFLKAPVGRVEAVLEPSEAQLEADITALHLWATPGSNTRARIDSHTREGAVEFYWPDDPCVELTHRHICRAEQLSAELIRVSHKEDV